MLRLLRVVAGAREREREREVAGLVYVMLYGLLFNARSKDNITKILPNT